MVDEEDINKILSIRPSCTGNQDSLRWCFGSNGSYTVKTGYYIQRSLDMKHQTTQVNIDSLPVSRNSMLAKLWRINIPPKLKMFWWKILLNGLPVAENLNKRGCHVYGYCQICGEELESIDHMLLQCRVSGEIWSFTLNNDSFLMTQINTVRDLFLYILHRISVNTPDILSFFVGWRI